MIGLRRSLKLPLLLLCTLAILAFSGSSASAAVPWWHVNTVSAPAAQPGGEGRLVLEVSDLGDAPVNGLVSPVTIVDRLPVGVTATHVYGEGGGSNVTAALPIVVPLAEFNAVIATDCCPVTISGAV